MKRAMAGPGVVRVTSVRWSERPGSVDLEVLADAEAEYQEALEREARSAARGDSARTRGRAA